MYNFPIGIMLDSLRMDNKTAIKTAAKMGAKGLQLFATRGVNSPANLTGEKRRALLALHLTTSIRAAGGGCNAKITFRRCCFCAPAAAGLPGRTMCAPKQLAK